MPRRVREPRRRPAVPRREGLVVFAVAFVVYAAIGIRVVVHQNVIVFDALARLSHAYFVWYNDPPKLAAVGFVWPPVSTLVFLPAAAVKPLATSLAAMPLTSAAFGALLLVLLNRILTLAEIRRSARVALLAAFGLNPMILFYATNGMAEIVYLALLVAAVYFVLQWYLTRTTSALVLAAAASSLGILARYEVAAWVAVLTVVIGAALVRQHVSRAQLQASLVAFLAPVVYGVGLWVFFNWLIVGDPLHFVRHQLPGPATSSAGGAGPAPATVSEGRGAGELAVILLDLNWTLFPLTVVVVAALAALVAVRRDVMALTLAALIALNALATAAIVWASGADSYLQLRYNMRAMPLALVGAAWLYVAARRPRLRAAVVGATLALLLVSIPATWRTMQTYPLQYFEEAFIRALATGRDQEGTRSRGDREAGKDDYYVGVPAERRMAAEVLRRVDGPARVLTDDAQTFGVMLFTGRPDLFLDRIDRGDAAWYRTLDAPWGAVDYLLVTDSEDDRVVQRYPSLLADGVPGFSRVHAEGGFALFRVAATAPRR